VTHNVAAGYNIEPINTRVDVGIDNLSDKQPAILYQNNVLNGNVDPNTFDTIGRFYFARVTVPNPEGNMRPGMQGRAKVNTGWRPLGYVLLRRPAMWIWTLLWNWFGF